MKKTITLLLVCIPLFFAFAQEPLSIDMVLKMKTVTQATVSPDGKNFAYTLRVPREATESPGGPYTELWTTNADGSSPHRLVAKPLSVSSIDFLPDGKSISFLMTNKDVNPNTQLYTIDLAGGTPTLVTKADRSINSYKLSPDGKKIAYIATDKATDAETEANKRGEDWTVVDRNLKQSRLYVYDVEKKTTNMLTPETMCVWDMEWSPRSDRLVFQASKTSSTDDSYMFKQLYTVNLGSAPAPLCTTAGKLGMMRWSPDGKHIAFLGGIDLHDPSAGSVFIVSADGSGLKNTMKDFIGTADVIAWRDASTLLITMNVYSSVVLYSFDVSKKTFSPLFQNDYIFGAIDVASDGSTFATVANHATHPNELYTGSLETRAMRRSTTSNTSTQKLLLGKQESIRWKAKDGLEIEGVLIYPVAYRSGATYPLVCSIHGGPESCYQNGWTSIYFMWGQLLAARGYFVLLPNYRASTGRGVAFAKLDHKDLGGKEFQDVIDGISFLAKKGFVDPKRVGIGGFSYGGYFAALAATKYTKHFAASVMGAGISNWVSYIGTTDIPYENSLVHWNLWCYDHPQLCMDRSAMGHVNSAKTPLLIVHGEKDARVPLTQGMEIYTAFRKLNVPVEFVTYPREGHGLREVAHLRDFLDRTLNWFDKYLTP